MDDQVIVSHADSLSHAEIETQLQDGPGVLIVRGRIKTIPLLMWLRTTSTNEYRRKADTQPIILLPAQINDSGTP